MLNLSIHENGRKRSESLSEEVIRVGRAEENTIELDDLNSSRFHCEIRRVDDGYEVVDLGSRNGTSVNGSLVTRTPLSPGDRIQIGAAVLLFEPTDDGEGMLPERQEGEIFERFGEINRSVNSEIGYLTPKHSLRHLNEYLGLRCHDKCYL